MVLNRLTENYDQLTDLEKKIIEYIVANPKDILYLTANELAQKLYVSKTSIINLSKKLGFDGYSELRYFVKHHIESEEKAKLIPSFNDILMNIYEEVSKTLSLQKEENIKEIIDVIRNSRAVYIIARGASMPLADLFCSRLALLKIKSIFISDLNLIDVISENLSKGETLILMSLSGETQKIKTVAKKARALGIDVIALTSFSNNSLQKIANYKMFCFADNTETKYNDLVSRVGLHVLIQILISYLDTAGKETKDES